MVSSKENRREGQLTGLAETWDLHSKIPGKYLFLEKLANIPQNLNENVIHSYTS